VRRSAPRANAYLSKLIRQGCKVAICEQIEEPGQRDLPPGGDRGGHPGLVFSEECLDSRGNNFLAAVRFAAPFACAALDATTGEFFHEACDTEEALADALFRIAPAEFVALEGEGNPTTSRGKRLLEGKLLTLLSPAVVAAFPPPPGIGGSPRGPPVGGRRPGSLYYLFLHQPAALSEIGRVTEREGRRYLALDETAVRTLEIFSTMSGERKGSLLWAVDRTRTPMGARMLRAWLAAPLLDVERIGERHDAVGELLEAHAIRKSLSPPFDAMGTSPGSPPAWRRTVPAPATWGAARQPGGDSSDRAALGEPRARRLRSVKELLGDHAAVVARISTALADPPPPGYKDGGVFRPGYDAQVDELTHLLTHGKGMLAEMETRERQRTGIGGLKVGYNRVFGYYIEVTRTHLDKVPPDYIRKQTLANAERYITPELKEFEGRVLRAQEGRLRGRRNSSSPCGIH